MVIDAGSVRRDDGMNGTTFSGMGWREINDWMTCTRQADISPTFLRGMIYLSGEFAAQIEASRDMACQVPFDPAKD